MTEQHGTGDYLEALISAIVLCSLAVGGLLGIGLAHFVGWGCP